MPSQRSTADPSPADAPAPPLRPRLLPATRWGKIALLLIVVVALCRSLTYASSQPALLAPDEDYHWHYVNWLVMEKSFPSIGSPIGTAESGAMAGDTLQGPFLNGAVGTFAGRPHGVVARLDRLPHSVRYPAGEGATRNVLHAPAWHLGAAVVDRAAWDASPVTRLTLMRYWSAVLGMVGVYFAWLLAAQVFSRIWQQLVVPALLVFQPMAAFSSSTMTNDVLVLAGFTATLAWCAFLMRTRPSPRQGIGLGLALSLALLAKSTALALVPIVLLTLLLVWATHREARRAVLGIAGWAAGVAAIVAGWWYLYVLIDTGTLLGGTAPIGDAGPDGAVRGLDYVPEALWNWLSYVYPGYWFEYLGYEVTWRNLWYYLPIAVGVVCVVGLLWRVVALRRTLLDARRPELRQVLVFAAASVLIVLPPMWIDLQNSLRGLPWGQVQARFFIPVYPAVVVLMLLGLRQLTDRIPRLFAISSGVLVVVAAIFYVKTYVRWNLERFYGPVDGDWGSLWERVGWLKPEWVGGAWFTTLFVIAVVAAVAALALVVVNSVRGRDGGDGAEPPGAPGSRPLSQVA